MTAENEAAEPAPEAPPAELEKLKAEAAKAAEYLDLAKRTQAEFINWQNRARREREEISKYAIESFARELLPVLDALSKTLQHAAPAGDPIAEGVKLVEKEMLHVLSKAGIKPIVTSGKKFDPLFHEAIATVEKDGAEDGAILDEARRGYMIYDRVLRPTQVTIARKPA